MNIRKTLAAAALFGLAAGGVAYASGLFQGFPTATSITGDECIPADTNLTRGMQPATECIPPSMLGSWVGTASLRAVGNTGGTPAFNAADGNNSTPVITEIYYAELYSPVGGTATGVAVFNGSDVTDSTKLALYDANGDLVASTADTQSVGADAYQRIAFTAPVVIGPGTYYIAEKFDGTTSRFNTFAVGHFGAWKATGAVYADAFADSITPTTTFTANLGPIVGLY